MKLKKMKGVNYFVKNMASGQLEVQKLNLYMMKEEERFLIGKNQIQQRSSKEIFVSYTFSWTKHNIRKI